MSLPDIPCLSLAITRLTAAESGHYALWVLQAPYPSGYVHHDCLWPVTLSQTWETWQSLFSLRGLPMVPRIPSTYVPEPVATLASTDPVPVSGQSGYTSRLMQHLGVQLWQWLFAGPIQTSLSQSQGIAMGQGNALRLRLEIRDPELIALPWEIMQPQPGKQAISLSQQVFFSRTTSDVDPLPPLRTEQVLNVLLVLGHDGEAAPERRGDRQEQLKLQQEADALATLLTRSTETYSGRGQTAPVPCRVTTLLQPTPAELIDQLESGNFNVFFYAGHGVPAPDGGLLFLREDATLNGTELAQVLTRCRVKLAVFNACWGAQPDQQDQHAIPRSSLAEVLIHHGVPAVVGMRDSIADRESLSFIQVFAQALAERSPVDEAVAIARQHLLTLYKFNQPAWTLPVLYMHPEFDGELIKRLAESVTEIPQQSTTWIDNQPPAAYLTLIDQPDRKWRVQGGIIRVGSSQDYGNDLVLEDPGVSRKHAEIFCRNLNDARPTYFLRDFSRFGTLMLTDKGWQKIHRHEVPLTTQTQLKFGSSRGQTVEFVIDES
jgi:hypothetical protein